MARLGRAYARQATVVARPAVVVPTLADAALIATSILTTAATVIVPTLADAALTATSTLTTAETLDRPAVTQASYGFYADNTPTVAAALAAQDTAYTADLGLGDVNLHLRVRLQSTSAAAVPATDDWQVQWEKNTSGTWTDVVTGGSTVAGYNSPYTGEGTATTNRLGAGTGSFTAGKIAEDGVVDNLGWAGNNYTELLYTLTLKSADLVHSDTLRFRVLRNGVTATMTYTAIPTVSVSIIPVAPTARNLLLSNVTSTTVNLVWVGDAAARPAPTYLVEQSTDGTNFSAATTTGVVNNGVTVTGLAAPQTYWFRLTGSNASGSATSNVVGPVTVAPLDWKNAVVGTPGGIVTPANSASGGDPFTFTVFNATACSYDNARAHTGAVSMKMFTSAAASGAYAGWNWNATGVRYGVRFPQYWRGYLYLTAYPASDLRIVHTSSDRIYLTSTGTVKINADTPSTVSVALNQWVRLEGLFQASTNQAQVRIFNDPESTTPTETVTGTLLGTVAHASTLFGTDQNTPSGSTFWWDDVAVSDVDWIGPLTVPTVSAAAALTATSTLTATAVRDQPATATLSATSTLTATATVSTPMPVVDLGLLGTGTATTPGTTLAVTNTTGAVIYAGTLIHIVGTWDNIASVTAPTITSSTIGGGTAIANHATAVGSGVTTTAGSGIWHQCFRVFTTADIAIGATIASLTSNQSATARAAHAAGWSGVSITQRGTVATGVSTTGAPSVATTGTALAYRDLVLGSASFENDVLMTGDADTLNGSWSGIVGTTTSGGAADTNVGTGSQSKVVNAPGVQTYGPLAGVADSVACVYSLLPFSSIPTITQASYRFYADDGTESGSSPLQTQDFPYIADLSTADANLLLRLRLQSTNSTRIYGGDDFQLQWEKNASGTWTDVSPGGLSVAGYDSANLTDGASTTNRLGAGTGSFTAGKVSEDGRVDDLSWAGLSCTELLYAIRLVRTGLANDTLRFRVLRNGETTGFTYTQIPTISTVTTLPRTSTLPVFTDPAWSVIPPATATATVATGAFPNVFSAASQVRTVSTLWTMDSLSLRILGLPTGVTNQERLAVSVFSQRLPDTGINMQWLGNTSPSTGTFEANRIIAGSFSRIGSTPTWDPAIPYVRMRQVGPTVLIERSADAVVWTLYGSMDHGLDLSRCQVVYSLTGTSTAMPTIDQLNVHLDSSAALSSVSTLTAAAVRDQPATAALTATSTLTATATVSAGLGQTHSIWGSTTPPGTTYARFNDGQPIRVGMTFYHPVSDTQFGTGSKIVGGRLWCPPGVVMPATVQFYAYLGSWFIDFNTYYKVLTDPLLVSGEPPPDASVTVPITVSSVTGGWQEVTFPTPLDLPGPGYPVLIAYQFPTAPNDYLATTNARSGSYPFIQASDGSNLFWSEERSLGGPESFYSAYYRYGTSLADWTDGNISYGVDVLVTEPAAVAGTVTASAPLIATSTLTATALRTVLPTAALTATSTLTATADRIPQASAALVATSTLTATAVRAPQATASLTATSTLTATADRIPQASASLVATSTLVATAVRAPQATAALIAASTLTATAVRSQLATAALATTSTLTATADRIPQAAASLAATSTLSASADITRLATAALSATSTLVATGTTTGAVFGAASLSAVSTLVATGVREPQAAASLVATSTLVATAVRVPQATASLTATSTLTATADRIPQAAAALTATSTLTATGDRTAQMTAALVAVATLTATGDRVPQGAASLVATSTVAATAVRSQLATATLTAVSTLTATADRIPQAAASLTATSALGATAVQTSVVTASLTAVSTLSTTGVRVPQAAAALTGVSTLVATAVQTSQATAALTAVSTLTVSGLRAPQGSAALVATSTLTATAVREPQAAAALTAVSTLAAGAITTEFATVSLTATSTLTATADRIPQAAASLSAVSTLAAAGVVTQLATAALAATSTLTATSVREPQAAASLVATSTLTATAVRDQPATATLTGVSTLTTVAVAVGLASAPLTATSTMTATSIRIPQAAASLVAASTLDATALRTTPALASLTATSTLTATPIVTGIGQVAATLAATSTLTATAIRIPQAAASLVATETLTATSVRTTQATVALTATSTLTTTGVREPQAAASLTAASTLTAAAFREQFATAALTGVSTLTVTAVSVGIVSATAALTTTSTLGATAVRAPQAAASLVAASTLTATSIRVPQATAALTAISTLNATGDRISQVAASLVATSTLAATGQRNQPAAAALTATSTLTVAPVLAVSPVSATLTATSTLTATAVRTSQATASLNATSTLTSDAVRQPQAAASLTATSTLTVVAVDELQARATMTALATLTAVATLTGRGLPNASFTGSLHGRDATGAWYPLTRLPVP